MPHAPSHSTPVAIGYCRVSTERQASEDRTSLDDQRQAIEQLAARLGVPVIDWFRDEGASGATAERRPAFMRMLQYCERHPRAVSSPSFVLVLNDSRFGRFDDPAEATYWRFALRRGGWEVRFAEGDEVADGVGREVVRIVGAAQAGDYRKNIRANAKRGAKSTAQLGYWQQEAPLGYRRYVVHPPGRERLLEVGVQKASDERVVLALGPVAEVEAVQWAFTTYAAGEGTLRDLVIGLQQRAPSRRWSRGTVQSILRNPVYTGDVVGGRRGVDPLLRRPTRRPAGEWYGKRDAHPAIVSREIFAAVDRRLRENAGRRKGARNEYLLSGIVVCAVCGHTFVGGGGMNRARDPKGAYRFYKDSGGHSDGSVCYGSFASVGRHILDRAVIDTIASEVEQPTVQGAIRQAIDDVLTETQATGQDSRARLEKRRRDLERRRENLIGAIEDGTLKGEEARRRMDEVRTGLREVEQAAAGVQAFGRIAETLTRQRDRLLAMAADFRAVAARSDTNALRALILPWLHRATFDKRTRRLTLSIRRIPEDGSMQWSHQPRPAGRKQRAADTIERTLDLSQRAAKVAGWTR